jgi:hypothetical protein
MHDGIDQAGLSGQRLSSPLHVALLHASSDMPMPS